ncbi:MAG: bifunctional folylpolyglutamate synthase/dihydrofolate synthase [Candidatus Omnitrophica bacterium]|nr:bifunctional folylpolyglutamate synthase/dihydrofolate synthase [Candidatus Omnitrophota bacterium]
MQASSYLATFLNHEKDLTKFAPRPTYIERVRAVLSQLGSPQEQLKVIHIAGSKGKGSTAAFIANILREAGYTVGLFTSPHLYDVHERIRILKPGPATAKGKIFPDCISEKDLSRLIKKIRPQLESARGQGLTYFEVLTILAFCYFKEQKVGWVVLETGLGGRLDATNVCDAVASVIAPLSLEHTAQLGKTLAKIASEKAAIIKSAKSFVVAAPQKPEVLKVIKARCRDVGAKIVLAGKNSRFSSSLLGRHQTINASVAAAIAKVLKIPATAVQKGLDKTFWPLRFEIVSRQPLIILDGAHNPESCERLSETLGEVFPGKKWTLIFGSSEDKDIRAMARLLTKNAQDVILTSAKHPRAVVWDDGTAEKYFPKQNLVITHSVPTACRFAKKLAGPQSLIVVAGSLFVAAEARQVFKKV